MIAFALFATLAMTAPQPDTILQPRKVYSACLVKFQKNSLKEKMGPPTFSKALKTACSAEAAALKKALIDFDVAMGVQRSEAETNAAVDLSTYTDNLEESYKDFLDSGTMPE